jgi:ABC-type uncharacterized transport system ATPase subunit
VLELQRLTRWYGDLVVLDDLSFTVADGQTFGFTGPNGAGRTTAMGITLGVLAPDVRKVRRRGQCRNSKLRHHVGHIREDHGQTFSLQFARRGIGTLMQSTQASMLRPAGCAAAPYG